MFPYDKEIEVALDKLTKVKYIEMPNTKRERNYLKDMTLADARLWFRYRCQIIDNIKGIRSSKHTVETQHGVPTMHKREKRNPGASRKV